MSEVVVSTVDTTRLSYVMNLLAQNGHHIMFVGAAGTGKTSMINHFLHSLDEEKFLFSAMNMNYFTDSKTLQAQLEGHIDKRSGRIFGPPATKRLIYFVDDLNLPYIEEYGTQNALELMRQVMDHGSIFDRADLGFRKEIVDTQQIAAMNPLIGSFEVSERNQLKYATFACMMPSADDLRTIYGSIFLGHLKLGGFDDKLHDLAIHLANTSIALHADIVHKFLPSATKFVYNWNMRELTNIYQGLCKCSITSHSNGLGIARVWVHECLRVFTDRMPAADDKIKFFDLIKEHTKKQLGEIPHDDLFADNEKNIHTTWTNPAGGTQEYVEIPSMEKMTSILEDRLVEYNESNSIMDLVLFKDACEHVSRITRIISNPMGNAMLIGVGGSGKQSLARLSSFICGYEVKQLSVTSNFRVDDFKESLKEMYKLAGVKGNPITFLFTDSQIVNEKFLVFINDMLSSGWIPDLFARDEMDGIFGGLRNEAKAAGIPDNAHDMQDFFLSRVRLYLHIVLCFSPVGDVFRVRARRFPGLINCTAIDWFHPWPQDALISVAAKFIKDVDINGAESEEELKIKAQLAEHMAGLQTSVSAASVKFKENKGRFNYVTPKSFLELIAFYKKLLSEKAHAVVTNIDRLDTGLSTLRKTAADVAELQIDLKHTMEVVEEKKQATDALMEDMAIKRQDAEKQQKIANVEAEKAGQASATAAEIEKNADEELAAAKPAMEAAAAAVDCLSKAMLSELKNLGKPPAGVDLVTKCCLIMLEHEYKNHKWDRAKKMMGNVDKFKERLLVYRGEDIPEEVVKKIEPVIKLPEFTPENMATKSAAAANLCTWVVNIYGFNRIYVKVKPLMESLQAARASKDAADAQLAKVQAEVAEVEKLLQDLQDKFAAATEEKLAIEAKAAACLDRLDLAKRLVGGLSSENERWGKEIESLNTQGVKLTGDVMLAAAYVSYVGAFDKSIRVNLTNSWIEDLARRAIPMTEGLDPLDQLTSDANNAKMMSEGLPSDRVSIENGSIIVNASRWPLLIDPQLQGIKWLRKKEQNPIVFQLTQKRWLASLTTAISNGQCVIIENLGEEIDATLDPVLSRAVYKKGRSLLLKVGGEEVEYDMRFQLYLQTKLANPHYKPEIAAQCTLINFIATEAGLEDQLLQKVVKEEQPAMEAQKQELVAAFQKYKIQLHELEDNLLERLANAPEDILSDVPLIEGLEETKRTSVQINAAVEEGKVTATKIDQAREIYRPVAKEGAMLYFMLTQLCTIEHMYQYSLDSFIIYFYKSITKTPTNDDLQQRVFALRESLRFQIFTWISRGLFEKHKLLLLANLTFTLILRGVVTTEEIDSHHMEFLIRAPKKMGEDVPDVLNWLPKAAWDSVGALDQLEEFTKFSSDLVEAAPRFREWYNHNTPETEKLPLDWAGLEKQPFLKMLVVRCLRPDRMTIAVNNFVVQALPNGAKYANCDASASVFDVLEESFDDSTTISPIFFILSPGVDVVAEVDKLAEKQGFGRGESYHNVSMGQGQDVIAMDRLEQGHRNGHWVILNNIHLMPRWCVELEKKLDEYALEGSHAKFRVFLTADPSKGIPIGILNRSIKLTNEPPSGLKANLQRAFCSFSKEVINEADSKTKSILFGLCHFHAILMERKLYGPLGYNMMYPFSLGDLRDSAVCLSNYMEANAGGKIPWADLRYIFGEIMYGGHIVNDFDRLLANTYLSFFMKDELLEETEMFPYVEDEKEAHFACPLPTSYERYIEHIENELTVDTPLAFGLHTNAEIDFRTTQSAELFHRLMELGGSSGGGDDDEAGGAASSPQEVATGVMGEIQDRFTDKHFDVEDIHRSLDEAGPYQNVFLQEMELMNVLLAEIGRSLSELALGFAGELTMSDSMDELCSCLHMDRVPPIWAKRSWPSKRGLTAWLADAIIRVDQLSEWCNNPLDIPKVTGLNLLITPQSFLTAICQVSAQKNQLELDKLLVVTDVQKKLNADDIDGHSRDGAYISGLSMQGARWELASSLIEKSKPKEMFSPMPIINCRAQSADKIDMNNIYLCPCYKTTQRGPTWVFSAQLKTKSPPGRWVLAGVALIMDTT